MTILLNTYVASGRLIGVRSETTSINADGSARYLLEAEFDLEPAT